MHILALCSLMQHLLRPWGENVVSEKYSGPWCMCTRSVNVDYVHESLRLCVVIEPAHTQYKTKSHCPRAMGWSFKQPSKWQGQGSVELIRPLGHGLRQQFLLLMLGDSLHRRTKRDKVNLKVFLSHCSSSTFDLLMAAGQGWMWV